MDKYQIMITPKAKEELIDIGDYISFILFRSRNRRKIRKRFKAFYFTITVFSKQIPYCNNSQKVKFKK